MCTSTLSQTQSWKGAVHIVINSFLFLKYLSPLFKCSFCLLPVFFFLLSVRMYGMFLPSQTNSDTATYCSKWGSLLNWDDVTEAAFTFNNQISECTKTKEFPTLHVDTWERGKVNIMHGVFDVIPFAPRCITQEIHWCRQMSEPHSYSKTTQYALTTWNWGLQQWNSDNANERSDV